jgi:hypothetical protein
MKVYLRNLARLLRWGRRAADTPERGLPMKSRRQIQPPPVNTPKIDRHENPVDVDGFDFSFPFMMLLLSIEI